jgi:hypothetical protein
MTKARSNATAEAAKGDLRVGNGTNLSGILAVGSTGDTIVADSSTSTGLRYTAGTVQSNPVLNSAMQCWQRGTSIAVAASNNGYTADRWYLVTGASTAMTVSRQTTSDTTNLPNIQYCARVQRNSGQTGTGGTFANSFESINSIPFAGKTVTYSFYARAGANYSPTSSVLYTSLNSGTGTDQNIGGTYTGNAGVAGGNATLTTTWQRFTFTGTVSTSATEIAIFYSPSFTGTAGVNDYFEVTGVQIDIGSVALPFRTYAGTIQGELAACQRYYYRQTIQSTPNRFGSGWNNSTTTAYILTNFPATMRTSPTALEQTGTAGDYSLVTTGTTVTVCSAIPTIDTANQFQGISIFNVASGLTGGQACLGRPVNTNAYLGWSAEL